MDAYEWSTGERSCCKVSLCGAFHKPPWGRGAGTTPAERGYRYSRGFGKDLRECHGLPRGAAQLGGYREVSCVCLQGASVGQGGLGGGSVPAVHSWHSQPAACSHRAGVGDDRDRSGALGLMPAPAPRLRAVWSGILVCRSTRGAHWLHGGPAGLAGPSRSCVVQMREGCCAGRRAGCRCHLPGFWGRSPEQSNTAGMAAQGASAWMLPPLGLLGITVPVTAPTIHTAGVPTASDVCLASRGHGARLTQPGTT